MEVLDELASRQHDKSGFTEFGRLLTPTSEAEEAGYGKWVENLMNVSWKQIIQSGLYTASFDRILASVETSTARDSYTSLGETFEAAVASPATSTKTSLDPKSLMASPVTKLVAISHDLLAQLTAKKAPGWAINRVLRDLISGETSIARMPHVSSLLRGLNDTNHHPITSLIRQYIEISVLTTTHLRLLEGGETREDKREDELCRLVREHLLVDKKQTEGSEFGDGIQEGLARLKEDIFLALKARRMRWHPTSMRDRFRRSVINHYIKDDVGVAPERKRENQEQLRPLSMIRDWLIHGENSNNSHSKCSIQDKDWSRWFGVSSSGGLSSSSYSLWSEKETRRAARGYDNWKDEGQWRKFQEYITTRGKGNNNEEEDLLMNRDTYDFAFDAPVEAFKTMERLMFATAGNAPATWAVSLENPRLFWEWFWSQKESSLFHVNGSTEKALAILALSNRLSYGERIAVQKLLRLSEQAWIAAVTDDDSRKKKDDDVDSSQELPKVEIATGIKVDQIDYENDKHALENRTNLFYALMSTLFGPTLRATYAKEFIQIINDAFAISPAAGVRVWREWSRAYWGG